MRNYILLSFLLLVLLPSTTKAEFSISGFVYELEEDSSRTPLSDVLVTIQGTSLFTYTNNIGRFEFEDLRSSFYVLEAGGFVYNKVSKIIELNGNVELNFVLSSNSYPLGGINIKAITPPEDFSTYKIRETELEEKNIGLDVPHALEFTPSATVTSDAGTGIGYTGIRIRGTDPTRINVTINGIPLNDSESQGVYWVDLPDIIASADEIQVQRGVVSSTNGAGAFGGGVHISTDNIPKEPYLVIDNTIGSFNTFKNAIQLGTGELGKFRFEGRISMINSDGYIDRATADLNSYYLGGGFFGKKTNLAFISFGGTEVTYQAWGGVPKDSIDDREGRRYNPYTYENEVDDYTQTHYQLVFSQKLGNDATLNITPHYTRGAGYFEQYQSGQYLSDYGVLPEIVGTDTLDMSNLIRRRWLDNHFYGFAGVLNWKWINNEYNLGGSLHRYEGLHYGEVIWAERAVNMPIGYRYYENQALKDDWNVYLKGMQKVNEHWKLFIDLQYRGVLYEFEAVDNTYSASHGFFNPKAGFSYIKSQHRFYGSFGLANKEPNRNDYVESSLNSRPNPEQLYDYELAYRYLSPEIRLLVQLYYMDYHDQLVLNGQINDVGEYTRINVDRSYRTGIELIAEIERWEKLVWTLQGTYSRNRILEHEVYVDNWDDGSQVATSYSNTPIAFSPDIILGSDLAYVLYQGNFTRRPKEGRKYELKIGLQTKYVSKQYIDNTGNEDRTIDPYLVNHFNLTYTAYELLGKQLSIGLWIRNAGDALYETNAWVYPYLSGGVEDAIYGYYPQAERHFMFSIKTRF